MKNDAKVAARNIRKVLKSTYPGHKFSVRTERFAGGSSVEITWTDGPTGSEVEKLTKAFKGYDNGYYNQYIGVNRSVSIETMVMAARAAAEYYEVNIPMVRTVMGNPHVVDKTVVGTGNHQECLEFKIHRAVHAVSLWNVDVEHAFDNAYPI